MTDRGQARSPLDSASAPTETVGAAGGKKTQSGLKPVLSLWALVLFGLAFVGPTAPYTFFGVGAVQSHGHFAMVYLIAMIAVSFTAVSYGKMATAFPEAGSTYAYASRVIHPVAGYFAGWVMILDYLLMPMLCVIIIGATSHKLLPAIPYSAWVIVTSLLITSINLRGIEMTSRATTIFNIVLSISVLWFLGAAVWALTHGMGRGTLVSLEPFYSPGFSLKTVMGATPVAMLSFLGFDGISTLAEDAKEPKKNIARATILVCLIAGLLFILQTYLGQLIWPDSKTFSNVETAFSDIGRKIGGPGLAYLIVLLVVAQAWASGIASQASASRLLFGMARDGRLPRSVFGYLDPRFRTPTYSMMLMGGIAMVAGLLLDLDKAAELVNFGACAGFMMVNLSVIGYYFVRRGERRGASAWKYLASPAIGFLVCLWIWLSVSPLAMKVGAAWSGVGAVYLIVLIRRHGIDLTI
ncbi:MAG: APC family permease [Acidobacteriaceae bacterium]